MISKRSGHTVFVVEDWQPPAPALGLLLEELGHRAVVLPNVIEIVGKRVRRDGPDAIIVNARSLVIGDQDQWRRILGAGAASLVVVPPAANGPFFTQAKALGFSGLLDPPLSSPKVDLALTIALRNHRAASHLRREIRRIQAVQVRLRAGTVAEVPADSAL